MEVLDLPEKAEKVHALNKNNPSYAKISTQLKNKQSPDFLIIGGQKCSTEALYGYLENHLQIIKEGARQAHFFELNFERGVEWYSKQLTRSVAVDKVLLRFGPLPDNVAVVVKHLQSQVDALTARVEALEGR